MPESLSLTNGSWRFLSYEDGLIRWTFFAAYSIKAYFLSSEEVICCHLFINKLTYLDNNILRENVNFLESIITWLFSWFQSFNIKFKKHLHSLCGCRRLPLLLDRPPLFTSLLAFLLDLTLHVSAPHSQLNTATAVAVFTCIFV